MRATRSLEEHSALATNGTARTCQYFLVLCLVCVLVCVDEVLVCVDECFTELLYDFRCGATPKYDEHGERRPCVHDNDLRWVHSSCAEHQ